MKKTDPGYTFPDLNNALQRAGLTYSADRTTRLLYSTDASIYQVMPIAVVWPKKNSEVCQILEIARNHQVPVLPRGSGSSLAGQAIGKAIILDFTREMDQILEINSEENWARVQPGVVLGTLNRHLSQYNMMYGPDPASADRATVGGVIGNNATGAHSIIYGMSHDHLLDCEVVLSDSSLVSFKEMDQDILEQKKKKNSLESKILDGLQDVLQNYQDEIQNRFPKTFRNVAGYNLNTLSQQEKFNPSMILAGSEGTLGIITSAKIKLVPVPLNTVLYLVHFDELKAALESVPQILESKPSAVELIDQMLIRLARANPAYRPLLDTIIGDPEAVLVVEYQGDDIQELVEKESILSSYGSTVPLLDSNQQDKIWKARKVGLGILLSKRGDAKPTTFIEDAAVPVKHLAEYALEIQRFGQEIGVGDAAFYAHASAGLLHIRPLVNLKTKRGLEQMRLLAEKSLDLVLQLGGTITGEHGEGIVRGEFSQLLFGPELNLAFKEVKELFDPEYLLNPGKKVNPPKMDQNELLRYGPKYRAIHKPEETLLSFKEDLGFDRAVEMCNGAGVCRQLDIGVMCPSFKATRDESHSTRGRSNMLRAAISGRLGDNGLTSQELFNILDLCLSCQACVSECPSAVDMSKLKAEFTHQYYLQHGIPFRSWFFAHIAEISRLAQPMAVLINPILMSPFKKVLSSIGIHPNRQLPPFAKERFTTWYKKQSNNEGTGVNNGVVFFYDTYLEYNYPHIGQAVTRIFQKAGIDLIVLSEKADSGRPAYSKGLLKKSQKLAGKNLDLLTPYVEKGIPIIGCEPSVIVMLKKEYRDLVPGYKADLVAKSAMLVEEYLLDMLASGKISFTYDQQPRTVLYHGHCQQKAHFGTNKTIDLLKNIPNCDVREIQSTCCGMAGAFGYEKEHYTLSLEIAELSLAPQIRESGPGTIICASGTSCREQIGHTTNRNALHPLEVFASALA